MAKKRPNRTKRRRHAERAPRTPPAPTLDPTRWSEEVQDAHAAWDEEPDDPTLVARIRELRASFAQYTLELRSPRKLAAVMEGGADLGLRTLLAGNIRYAPLNEAERRITDRIESHIAASHHRLHATHLVPAMLYFLPHRVPRCQEITRLPSPILEPYLDFIFLPVRFFSKPGEIEAYSRFLHAWVDDLHRALVVRTTRGWPKPEQVWARIAEYFFWRINLVTMYATSGPMKEILVQRAEIMQKVLRDTYQENSNYCFPERSPDRKKIRIGVLARDFWPGTETYSILSIYGHLDRTRFEIILFSDENYDNELAQHCASRVDRAIVLEGKVPDMARQIRDCDLDLILLGSNVSVMTHNITMLSLYRLARVQVTPNIAVATTGMRHWDYYMDLVSHTEGFAANNCVERLVSAGVDHAIADFGNDTVEEATFHREALQIEDDAIVYVSAASVFKITPELVESWATILEAVPRSYLLLCPFNPNWGRSYPETSFIHGIEESFLHHGLPLDRLKILSIHGTANIRGIFRIADIMLDSYICTAGLTVNDIFATEIVPVTFYGDTFRTQTSACTLGVEGFEDIFAKTHEEYEKIAIGLAKDPQWRASVKGRIQKRRQVLLDPGWTAQVGARISRCLENLVAISDGSP